MWASPSLPGPSPGATRPLADQGSRRDLSLLADRLHLPPCTAGFVRSEPHGALIATSAITEKQTVGLVGRMTEKGRVRPNCRRRVTAAPQSKATPDVGPAAVR